MCPTPPATAARRAWTPGDVYRQFDILLLARNDEFGIFTGLECRNNGHGRHTILNRFFLDLVDHVPDLHVEQLADAQRQNQVLAMAVVVAEQEKKNLREAGVTVFSLEQIDRIGMYAAISRAIEQISQDADGIYLSFDVDSLDPRHAPGVGTPVSGGLTYREAHLACEMVAETGKLAGMDMVEVNPILDVQNQTAHLAVELILSALGRRVWGN